MPEHVLQSVNDITTLKYRMWAISAEKVYKQERQKLFAILSQFECNGWWGTKLN